LEEAYAKTAAANEAMELLSALVQHDVYSPLAAMSAACREAVVACARGEVNTVVHFVSMVEDRLRSVEGAVGTLGLLADGSSEATNESYSVKDVVDELIEDVDAECRERRVSVGSVDKIQWPLVRIRREELYHVLRNLVTNSVRVVSDDGSGNVTISVAQMGDRCEVLVADNGPGMPDDVAARAFRVSSRRLGEPRPRGGFGVGLALCGNLVRKWGGSIEYKRREEGGALFAVRIPVGLISGWC